MKQAIDISSLQILNELEASCRSSEKYNVEKTASTALKSLGAEHGLPADSAHRALLLFCSIVSKEREDHSKYDWIELFSWLHSRGYEKLVGKLVACLLERKIQKSEILNFLASRFATSGQHLEAISLYEIILRLEGNNPEAAGNLAVCLLQGGLVDDAFIISCKGISSVNASSLHFLQQHFTLLCRLCDFETLSRVNWHKLLGTIKRDYLIPSVFLHLLPYSHNQDTAAAVLSIAKRWSSQHFQKHSKHPQRPLRSVDSILQEQKTLALVQEEPPSYSFGILATDSPGRGAAPFIEPLSQALVALGHKVTTYHLSGLQQQETGKSDDGHGHGYSSEINVGSLDIGSTRKLILSNGHDILVDTEGLTGTFKSIPILSNRLAGIQVSWLGYPGTTGCRNIDYIVVDRFLKPVDHSAYRESMLVLDASSVTRRPLPDIPITNILPQEKRSFLTFGTLCSSYKVTPDGIKAWSRVMSQVSCSVFLFIRPDYTSFIARNNIIGHFEKHGISGHRIYFYDNHRDKRSHLDCYNELDICLDSIPFTGGVTTIDSLWMGVPAITLEGEYMHERVSSSILHNARLSSWVGESEDTFVERAVRLSFDFESRKSLRSSLRRHLLETDLFSPSKSAKSFVKALSRLRRSA